MSIHRQTNGNWKVVYREHGGGQRTRTFDRMSEAAMFETSMKHFLLSGTYIAPEAGRVTFAAAWLAARPRRPASVAAHRPRLKCQLLPVFGGRPPCGDYDVAGSGFRDWIG